METTHNRKILLVFYEPFRSGISRHVHYLVSTLQDEPYDFWVLYSGHDETIASLLSTVIPAHRITRVASHRLFSLDGFFRLRKIIRQQGIDTVHIHNLQTILWGYAGSITAGCRHLVFTPHIDTACAGKAERLFSLMWRLFSPFTSTLVALSEPQREWFRKWKILPDGKIRVICNHISESQLKAGAAATADDIQSLFQENLMENRFIVAQIGRLDRQKDPLFLIKAALLLKKTHSEILFVLVGDGPLRQKVEKAMTDHGLQKTVLLTGHLQDIVPLLGAADVVSLTSRWEGMPYALLEAVCFKKPVIATDIPGNRGIVEDNVNGYLARSEKEFAEKLLVLFKSPALCRTMGEEGYRRNRHLFTVGKMKEQLRALYCSPSPAESSTGGRRHGSGN